MTLLVSSPIVRFTCSTCAAARITFTTPCTQPNSHPFSVQHTALAAFFCNKSGSAVGEKYRRLAAHNYYTATH
eukprot:807250-Pyramimonas_sp.AAC.1